MGRVNILSSRLYENGYSAICYGEGERTMAKLVQALESGLALDDIKGISNLNEGKEAKTPSRDLIQKLDEIPFPARDLLVRKNT